MRLGDSALSGLEVPAAHLTKDVFHQNLLGTTCRSNGCLCDMEPNAVVRSECPALPALALSVARHNLQVSLQELVTALFRNQIPGHPMGGIIPTVQAICLQFEVGQPPSPVLGVSSGPCQV
jgi:hypothetical protein